MRTSLVLLTSAGVACSSWGIVRRHDVSDRDLIEAGQRFQGICTVAGDGHGVLIGDRWVLTAAHVAQGLHPFEPTVRFGNDEPIAIVGVAIHPLGESPPGEPPEVDLALLELAEHAACASTPIYRSDQEVGMTAWLIGAGDFGVPGAIERSDALLRAGTNRIDDTGPVRIFMRFDAPPAGTPLECVSAPGDSGGPAMVGVDGVMQVAGISSGSAGGPPGTYGVREVYARVSTQQNWIDHTIAQEHATPISPGESIDLSTAPWPQTRASELAREWLRILSDADWPAMRAFDVAHRPPDVLASQPEEVRRRRFEDRAAAWGSVEPLRACPTGDALWVLVQTERAGLAALRFMPTPRGRLEAVLIRPMDLTGSGPAGSR